MSFWKREQKIHLKAIKAAYRAKKMDYRLAKKEIRMKNRCYSHNNKGRCMCWELIFGVLLIIWGFFKIFGTLFNFHIPVFGILFGIILLYLGLMIITGSWRTTNWCYCSKFKGNEGSYSTCMGSSTINVEEETIRNQTSQLEYKTVLGSSVIDLTHITPETLKNATTPLAVNVDTVFGKTS